VRYRIRSNGKSFSIQRKTLFGWEDRTISYFNDSPYWGGDRRLATFVTEEGCEDHMKKHYGESAERVREWRTV
jgi:hypothetical protein